MEPKAPLAHCDECPLKDRPFVPGDGPSKAERVVVGEAPGETEVKMGKPFVGQAGTRLRQELHSAGINPTSVYITNAVLCHPEGNRDPSLGAIRACRERLIREIEQREANKVLAFGKVAARAVLDEVRTIEEFRLAGPHRSPFLGDDVAVGVTNHPAARIPNRNLILASDIRAFLGP